MHVKDLPKRCSQIPVELIIYILKNRVAVRAQINTNLEKRLQPVKLHKYQET